MTSACDGGGGDDFGDEPLTETLTHIHPALPFVKIEQTRYVDAEAGDEEMAARISTHRARRGSDWRTIEAPRHLVAALQKAGTTPVLVDCLTVWLSNLMIAGIDLEAETAHLEKALAAASGPVVLVANEVGSGIVPDHPLGRKFRDLQGTLNQRMAARADRVVLMVAGLPLVLKEMR